MILFFFRFFFFFFQTPVMFQTVRARRQGFYIFPSFFLSFFACSPTSFPFALVVISFLLSLALP